MAKLLLVAVMDTKVGAFTPPFCCKTRGEAIRSFTDACADDKIPFKAHPGDYVLYMIGEFDDGSGLVTSAVDRLIGADEIG